MAPSRGFRRRKRRVRGSKSGDRLRCEDWRWTGAPNLGVHLQRRDVSIDDLTICAFDPSVSQHVRH